MKGADTSFDLWAGGFDWDVGNSEKCRKHGLSLETVEAVLTGDPIVMRDHGHSEAEARFRGVGRTGDGRPVFVVFTLRAREGLLLVRPISARYMHAREIESYEEAAADISDR